MASNFNIQHLHLLNVQVSEYPHFPMPSMSNFISGSRNLPHFRSSITTSLPMNKLHSLSLSSSSSVVTKKKKKSSSSPVTKKKKKSSSSAVPVDSDSPNERSFVVCYLINSCGLPPELARSRARCVKFNNSEKPDAVLAFLKKYGFTQTQLSDVVAGCPQLLLRSPEKTLFPKLEFLSSLGLSNGEIAGVVSTAPLILRRSLRKVIIPCFNLLRSVLGSDDKAISMIKRDPMVLTLVPEVDNIHILLEAGVPLENIMKSMRFGYRGYVVATNNFREIVGTVKEMGVDPSSMIFLSAIRSMRSMTKSTWENKVQVLKKYGWSDHDVLVAFKKDPRFIMASEEKINGAMDFLVNRMGMEAATVANFPKIISLSLKKTIVPRCSICHVLLEKVSVKKKRIPNIIKILTLTEKDFQRRVIKFFEDEAPEILTLYQEILDEGK